MGEVRHITIPYRPRDQFNGFHDRDKRWSCIVAHRRAGKTVACINDLIRRAFQDNKDHGRYAYVAPFFSQAKAVAWDYLLRYTDLVRTSANVSELQVELLNGARIRLYGADNPDALRGLYLDGVVLDEVADMRPRVWGEIIRPLLSDRKGWAVFIGTPRGKNEFWSIYRQSQAPEWFSLVLKASQTGIVDPQELAESAKTMSEDQYLQEWECSFEAAILGAFYGRELRQLEESGRITEVPYEKAVPVHTAWDLGYTDDTAIWWYQVVRGEVRFLRHYAASGLGMDDYLTMVKELPYKYGNHYLPHDAKAKTLAARGKSIQEMARDALGNSVRIVPDLSVQDGIQAARAMLQRAWFDVGCEEGIEALRQYQREWDEDKKAFRERPRHDWTSHTADAFRMAAVAWKEEAKPPQRQDPKWKESQTINEIIADLRRKRLNREE